MMPGCPARFTGFVKLGPASAGGFLGSAGGASTLRRAPGAFGACHRHPQRPWCGVSSRSCLHPSLAASLTLPVCTAGATTSSRSRRPTSRGERRGAWRSPNSTIRVRDGMMHPLALPWSLQARRVTCPVDW